MKNLERIKELCDHSQHLEEFYEEILKAAKRLPEEAIFCEIGTRAGGSALLTLEAIKESGITRQFITIDPYGNKPFKTSSAVMKDIYGDLFYRIAMKEITNLCSEENLDHTHFKLESEDFIKIWPQVNFWRKGNISEKKFGYCYLDGEHNEEVVEKELDFFVGNILPAGLIVIDDIEHLVNSKKLLTSRVLSESFLIGNRAFYIK